MAPVEIIPGQVNLSGTLRGSPVLQLLEEINLETDLAVRAQTSRLRGIKNFLLSRRHPKTPRFLHPGAYWAPHSYPTLAICQCDVAELRPQSVRQLSLAIVPFSNPSNPGKTRLVDLEQCLDGE